MALQSVLKKRSGPFPESQTGKLRHGTGFGPASPAAKGRRIFSSSFLSKNVILPSFRSIRAKATLYVLLLLMATTSVSYFITLRIQNAHIMDEIIRKAESLSRSVASAAGYNLISEDLLGLDNMVFKIKNSNPDISFIAVVGAENEVIVHSDIRKAEGKIEPAAGTLLKSGEDGTLTREIPALFESHFEVTSPIIFMEKNLGSVVLDINKSVLLAAQSEARRRIVGFFAVILCLGMASSIFLSSNLTRPIKALNSGVEEFKQGNRSRPLRVYSKDELGTLTANFNEMTELITEQRDKLGRYAHELEEAYVSTIRVLAAAIDARDSYTLGHSTRVSEFAVGLARQLGLSSGEVEEVEIACLFHDVGKIRIPDSILHKRGRLSPAEFREMRKHPEYGAEILSKASSLYKFIPAVRHHHERHDGTGYPDGLCGAKIPLAAAIISLADAFDAMTSDRPYRKAKPREKAIEEIKACAGKQFNYDIVPAFLKFIQRPNRTSPKASPEGMKS